MKERPILFSAPMVRAILEGRKTQTRRVVKPDIVQAIEFMGGCEDHEDGPFPFVGLQYATRQNDNKRMMPAEWLIYCTEYPEEGAVPVGQVYGAIGDQLWVRESWNAYSVHEVDNGIFEAGYPYSKIPKVRPLNAEILYSADGHEGPWRPSIHMPSWASRIQLEITGIRVERLQDISEEDAIAEGIDAASRGIFINGDGANSGEVFDPYNDSADAFRLMVVCRMQAYPYDGININDSEQYALAHGPDLVGVHSECHNDNPEAATRHAIFWVAVAIGKQMINHNEGE